MTLFLISKEKAPTPTILTAHFPGPEFTFKNII